MNKYHGSTCIVDVKQTGTCERSQRVAVVQLVPTRVDSRRVNEYLNIKIVHPRVDPKQVNEYLDIKLVHPRVDPKQVNKYLNTK